MERSIILKAHDVRGILDGRQTQLRRIIKPQPFCKEVFQRRLRSGRMAWTQGGHGPDMVVAVGHFDCPFGEVGDRLWGRETWSWMPQQGTFSIQDTQTLFPGAFIYQADERVNFLGEWDWCSSSQMPRWASRILLEIVSVRVERLQDISEKDARAEGCPYPAEWAGRYIDRDETAKTWFATELNCANGQGSWDANPWVWAVEFKRVAADE